MALYPMPARVDSASSAAAGGMTMDLVYADVTDPFRAGAAAGNDPE